MKTSPAPKATKPSDQEIARRVTGLHAAYRARKAAEVQEKEHKDWFKARAKWGPIWSIGSLIVELASRARSSLDKKKAEAALGPAAWKKLLSCYVSKSHTEVQVYEEGAKVETDGEDAA